MTKNEHKSDKWAMLMVIGLSITISLGIILIDNRAKAHFAFNPDLQYCTGWDKSDICTGYGKFDNQGDMSCCTSFRDKTPEELAIDHCNDNPDSEDCFCEIKRNLTEVSCDVTITISINLSEPEQQYMETGNIIEKCIKARPKTECEKGNPDFTFFDIDEQVRSNVKYLAGTNCREKTEIEKELGKLDFDKILKESECKNLIFSVILCLYKDSRLELYCDDIREAWREKNCSI